MTKAMLGGRNFKSPGRRKSEFKETTRMMDPKDEDLGGKKITPEGQCSNDRLETTLEIM